MQKRSNFLLLSIIFSFPAYSAGKSGSNLLAVSQGISSPAVTSVVNYSSGFTHQNPVGTIYQNGVRLSGQYDADSSDGKGAELGAGNGKYGLALGYYEHDCNSCDEDIAGAVWGSLGKVTLGARFEDGINTFGAGIALVNSHSPDPRPDYEFKTSFFHRLL